MTECEKYQELISAMLDGELTESEQAQVEAHIKDCDECRAMYEVFAAVGGVLATDEDVPDTLHSGIMEKVNAAAKANKTQRKIIRLRPILAAAACLVVVVGTALALKGNLPGMKSAESEAPAAADAPMMMAISGAARSDGAAFDYSTANSAATESFAITADAGECAAEESAPAEKPMPEDGFSAAVGAGEPKEAGASLPDNVCGSEANAHILTVKATNSDLLWDDAGFTAEVLDAAAVPCEVGDTVRVVFSEETEPFAFNIIPGGEYRIAVEGYEQTEKDGISVYAAAIWLT